VRGGGGKFGVVTAFTLRLHPLKDVFAGNLVFRMDDDGEVLREFRVATANAPDELTLFGLVFPGDDAKPLFGIEVCYCGEQAKGETALAPLRRSKHLLSDQVKLQSYLSLQSSNSADEPPSFSENRTGFLTQLDDDVIAILNDAIATAPANYNIWLVHFHGAVAAVPVQATAFPMRAQGFGYGITAYWDKPAQRAPATQWTIALAKRLAPLTSGGYVNMMDREDSAAVRTAYGANYERLPKLKQRYDPANFFALNQNIRPA
jgi:FAD/FMN-containing dehydrogenase